MAPAAPLHAAPPATYSSEDDGDFDDAPPATAPPPDEPATAMLPAVVPPAIIPEADHFSFYPTALHGPSDFYGHVLIDNIASFLSDLMKDLQKKLNRHASASFAPPPEEYVTVGSFWMGQRDENWYRVRVLEVMETSDGRIARVLDVDYGYRRSLALSDLRPLPHHLAEEPAFALHMALAFVEPVDGTKWSSAATRFFQRATRSEALLWADKKGQRDTGVETITEVVLLVKMRPTMVNINKLLVEGGVARVGHRGHEDAQHQE